MKRAIFAWMAVLLIGIAGTASGYVLLEPFQRVGDPSMPFTYYIELDLDEPTIAGDHEFDIVRESVQAWSDASGVDCPVFDGGDADFCGIHSNGVSEISFQDCQDLCGAGVLGVTYPLRTAAGEGFWTTGTDSIFIAKLESDFVYCKGWNWDDPDQDWHPCPGGRYDARGVGTHEVGHMLGLGHSQFAPATMYFAIGPCDSTKSSLYFDDQRATRVLYRDRQWLQYDTHDNLNGQLSVTNCGNIAYTGSGGFGGQAGAWGDGFVWPSGGNNHIFECSMAFGVVNGRVSDNFRTTKNTPEDDDFIQVDDLTLATLLGPGDQVGTAAWDDSKNDQGPYDIKVVQQSYTFPNPPDDDYAIVRYFLINEGNSTVSNLRVGIFTDFDLDGTFQNNSVDYDADIGLGYITDPGTTIEVGWKVLNPEGAVAYRALYATSQDAPETYTDANKTAWFNSGFTRTSLANNDIAQLIVTGNFSIDPGDTATAAFALVGGSSHTDLRANALAAQDKYETLGTSDVAEGEVRLPISLGQNAPNPFGPSTQISFALQERSEVHLIVTDPAGRIVRTLASGVMDKGRYSYNWDGRDQSGREVAGGVYFYSLETPKHNLGKKMVLMK